MILFLEQKKINETDGTAFQRRLKRVLENCSNILKKEEETFVWAFSNLSLTKLYIDVKNNSTPLLLILRSYIQLGK